MTRWWACLAFVLVSGCYRSKVPGEPPPPPPIDVVLPELPEIQWVKDPLAPFRYVRILTVGRERTRGEAIVVFTCLTDASEYEVRAFWYDGAGHFTRSVRLAETTTSLYSGTTTADVVFLDSRGFVGGTEGATNGGRARHGDALIAFAGGGNESTPDDVFVTSFDRSSIGLHATNRQSGFVTTPTRMELPRGTDGIATSAQPSDLQWFSDSFEGATEVVGSPSESTRVRRSGRPTSTVALAIELDSADADTVLARSFELGSETDVPEPLGTGSASVLRVDTDGGERALVHGPLRAHGNCLFGYTSTTLFGGGGDAVGTCASATSLRSIRLGTRSSPGIGDDTTIAEIYGPPEGLGAFFVMLGERGFTDDATGSRAGDEDRMIARLAPDGSGREIVEADVYTAPIDATDEDHDGDLRRPGTLGNVVLAHTQLSADGTLLYLETAQRASEAGDLNDRDASVGRPASTFVSYIRVLDVANLGKPLSSALSDPVGVPFHPARGSVRSPDRFEPSGVTDFRFQTGDATGPWQLDSTRMHFTYELFDTSYVVNEEPRNNALYFNHVDVTRSTRGKPALRIASNDLGATRVPMPDDQILRRFQAQIVDAMVRGENVRVFFEADDPAAGIPHLPYGRTSGSRVFVWDGHVRTACVEWDAERYVPDEMTTRAIVRTPSRALTFENVRVWDGLSASRDVVTRAFGRGSDAAFVSPPYESAPAFATPQYEGAWNDGFDGHPLVSGDTVGIAYFDGGTLDLATTSADFTNADSVETRCLECDGGAWSWYWVSTARRDDTLHDSLFFITRPREPNYDGEMFLQVRAFDE